MGYSPCDCRESGTTEHTHTFSLGLLAFSEAGLEETGLTRHWVCLKVRKTWHFNIPSDK